MSEERVIKRAVYAEGLLMLDANGESPLRNSLKDLGATALSTENEQVVPLSSRVDLVEGSLEATAQSAA